MDWLLQQIGERVPEPRRPPERVYIRFGLWSGRSRNFATGETEYGISVYPATLVAPRVVELTEDADVSWDQLWGRLAFPVTGLEVGRGSDGEPVIRRVRLLPYAISTKNFPREAWWK